MLDSLLVCDIYYGLLSLLDGLRSMTLRAYNLLAIGGLFIVEDNVRTNYLLGLGVLHSSCFICYVSGR